MDKLPARILLYAQHVIGVFIHNGSMIKLMTAIALTTVLFPNAASAAKKVKMKDLPAAVQKTVAAETKNAQLAGIAVEKEGEKTLYELETKVNGMGRDLMIDGAGAILSVEEQVTIDKVPAGARAAMERAAAGGKINKVEILTKGKTVTYEAVISKKGRNSEVTFTAYGQPVK